MRVLLDTHAFLWFLLDDPKLSATAQSIISDARTMVYISPAIYWEIAIKISLGKYALPESYALFMERELAHNDFHILPILPKHTTALIDLPFHHRDPFDRLLIAQSLAEAIPLVSCDGAFDSYGVTRIW
ncbi:type II toxin-antitoxin system VapC family toxin [Ectothiorhodospiraceae bacterium BW-2]|nr:type II toxin-antitoxin system VapC family toxin [Ectothiorhodospiraceae bacterium BW-2]